LKSYVLTKATGERLTPYGERPTGYLSSVSGGENHYAVSWEKIAGR
jgi:hypothetical protein